MLKRTQIFLLFIISISLVSAGAYSSNINTGDSIVVTTTTLTGNFTNLSQLLDTNIPSPTDGNILTYDSVSGKWIDSSAASVGDTNETTRVNTITGDDCGAGDYAYGFDSSGNIQCREDLSGGSGGNPFDQSLNTTDNATFVYGTFTEDVDVSGTVSATNFLGFLSWTNIVSTFSTNINLTHFRVIADVLSLNISFLDDRFINKAGDNVTGDLNFNQNNIINISLINGINISNVSEGTHTINTDTTYDNSSPISLTGTTFGLIPCSDGEIYKYNSTLGDFECSIDDSAASGMANWVLASSDTGGSETITDGETVTFSDDTQYLTATRSTNTITYSLIEAVLNSTIGAEIINDVTQAFIEALGFETGAHTIEVDPLWTANQSFYSTTAEILVFGYYNSTDFVITDYFTKSEILGFDYYNSSDFSISDYFTASEVLAFNYYNSTDFDINDYFTQAEILGFDYYNSTDFVISDYSTTSQANNLYAPTGYGDDWNKTYADTLYADISVTGDNESWNESYADTIYVNVGENINATLVNIALGTGSPTVDQLQAYLDNTGSAGFFSGGTLSDGGSGTLDVAEGSGFIRTTNDDNAELQSFKWATSLAIAVPDDTTQYVYVDYTGTISLSQNEFLESPDQIKIGVVTDEAGSISHTFALGVRLQESVAEAGRFIRRVFGISRDVRRGGLIMGQSGDANRDITLSEGSLWWGRTEYMITSFDTSGADTFDTYSASGKESSTASQFPNTQYDNAGTLTTMTNNRWANLFFFLEPDEHITMVYGREQFVTEALAENEGVPSTSLPSVITETSILIARFTFQESSNTATISSAFEQLFANAGITDHGDLAGLIDDDHTQYILADGSRSLSSNWDQGAFNLTNTASWFLGIVNYSSIQNHPADQDTTYTAGSNMSLTAEEFSVDMTGLESYLDTIYAAISSIFSGAFTDLDFSGTTGFDDLVDNDTTYSALSEFSDDLNHVEDNESWNQILAETLFADISITEDNESWNQSFADTLYYAITNPFGFWNDTYSTFNKTYADTLYADISVAGTVTNIVTGNGLTGGPITTTGTISTSASTAGASQYSYWDGNSWEVRNDDDTTYSAGNGINLVGTTFTVAGGTALTQDLFGLSVTADAIGDTQLTFNTGQALTTSSSPTFAGANLNGDLNISDANIYISQGFYTCHNQDCTANITYNGTHTVWY